MNPSTRTDLLRQRFKTLYPASARPVSEGKAKSAKRAVEPAPIPARPSALHRGWNSQIPLEAEANSLSSKAKLQWVKNADAKPKATALKSNQRHEPHELEKIADAFNKRIVWPKNKR